MRYLVVSGSTAYDTQMHYDGDFCEYLSNNARGNTLQMSLTSEIFQKNHGGAGANIAYNLALLGENPILLTAVGEDYSFDGIMQDKVNLNYIHRDSKLSSANSVIISDSENNRLTFFHPGAMNSASESKVSYLQETPGVSIISPNHVPTMIEHTRELKKKKSIVIADPSQQITAMTPDELKYLFEHSDYLMANQFEFQEIISKLSITEEMLISQFQGVIVTQDDKGSTLYHEGNETHIPAIEIEDVDDTTGAGDAYRAGVLFALIGGKDVLTGCQLGTILASYCIGAPGSQYHHFTIDGVMLDMQTNFGVEIDLYERRKY